MATAHVEMTDTFGGEANYSWVNRYEFECGNMTDAQVERKARKLVGLSGVRTRRQDLGDMVRWDIPCACICAFLTFE